MASDVTFEVDLTDWDRTVRDIEAEHDDFSGETFKKYARGLFRLVLKVLPPPTVGAGKRARGGRARFGESISDLGP